jgi:hypothetical protein
MPKKKTEEKTEWIFCKDIKGELSGLNPNSKVLEKSPKTIIVHGKEVKGWNVLIVQEESEGHLNLDYCKLSDE